MKSPHLLRASGNVRRLKENLVNVVDGVAINAIEAEICTNVAQLFALGRSHYSFAVRQDNRFWRQKVSRLYYGAYNVSRAVRLFVNGEYSVDAADHKKIDALPDNFPNKNTYANRLTVLGEDRNLCDYDHTAGRRDLVLEVEEASQLVADFVRDARAYLKQRGVKT
jgi:hypothetical protein